MRWIVGLLLVAASILKAIQLFAEPTTALASAAGRWLVPLQIGLELAIGLLALSDIWWRQVRWLALLLFSGFAGYSLYLALAGAVSCRCFGPVQIHPWWMFGLDVAVVLGLLVSSLRGRQSDIALKVADIQRSTSSQRHWHMFAAGGACLLVSAFLIRHLDRQTAVADDLATIAGGLVILEPEQWIGKQLPIAEFIDVDLSRGDWIALFHRHDCPSCQDALPHYEQLARAGQKVALIEIPPYGEIKLKESTCQNGRLKDDRDWFVQTPVEVRLRNGIVAAVKVDGQ